MAALRARRVSSGGPRRSRTQAEIEASILDRLFGVPPTRPFARDDKQALAKRVSRHIWQQSANPWGTLAA